MHVEATIGYILNAPCSNRNIPVKAAQIKNDIVLGYFYIMQFPIKSLMWTSALKSAPSFKVKPGTKSFLESLWFLP